MELLQSRESIFCSEIPSKLAQIIRTIQHDQNRKHGYIITVTPQVQATS